MLVLVLVLILNAEEAENLVTTPDTITAPLIDPTLAPELDIGAEVVVPHTVPRPVVLAPTNTITSRAFAVVSASELSVSLVLVSLPPPLSAPTAALNALSAAASALLTAASDSLYCVPPHVVFTLCNGAVKKSG